MVPPVKRYEFLSSIVPFRGQVSTFDISEIYRFAFIARELVKNVKC
jgi:hypothetical protein